MAGCLIQDFLRGRTVGEVKSGVTDTDNGMPRGRDINLILIMIMINCMLKQSGLGRLERETDHITKQRALNKG